VRSLFLHARLLHGRRQAHTEQSGLHSDIIGGMPGILKSIAVAAGKGIALGVYNTAAHASRREPEGSGGLDPSFIEPLLDRVEQLEAHLAHGRANAEASSQVAFLKQSIAAQEAELQALRVKVDETERRAAAAVAWVETRVHELRSEIEAQVEARVAERMGALERAVSDQLRSIERLAERPLQPSSTVLPFEAQLAEAVQRDLPGETRVRVIKDNEPERRHRFPLGRTFAFLLAVLLPGFRR